MESINTAYSGDLIKSAVSVEQQSTGSTAIVSLRKALQAGTLEQASLTLAVVCLGAGIFASFYVYYATGFVVGSCLLVGGLIVTALVSWTLVRCADHWQVSMYEQIAMKAYGPKMAKFTIMMEVMS
jgi:hypothetical protein